MAAFTSRHGSRYPDPGAYQEWIDFYAKLQNASFTATGSLAFIKSWKPVLTDPAQQIAKLSPGGHKELYDMGVNYRFRYPQLFKEDTPFITWANLYPASPRVVDSARLFARGYLGPSSSTLGTVIALNASSPLALFNSLAASDLCPAYKDFGTSSEAYLNWNSKYGPPIVARLNRLLRGSLTLTLADVTRMPYLCGFETQILGFTSPWCAVLSDSELSSYAYAQDLRYWYGPGPGAAGANNTLMLPFLSALVRRFQDGPRNGETHSDGTNVTALPDLIATFTNDGQVNQLIAQLGVFDDQTPLIGNSIPRTRKYQTSRFTTMRGTVGFERLVCGVNNTPYIRIMLNDAIYPIVGCESGPGKSCPLDRYGQIIDKKKKKIGSLGKACGIEGDEGNEITTFLMDSNLPFAIRFAA